MSKTPKLTFDVEYFSNEIGDPMGTGDHYFSDTLFQKKDESDDKFTIRIIDFINKCKAPLTKISDVFLIEDVRLGNGSVV